MNCWQILGIEPTPDEALIKKAYAKALKHNKPDKNPEGFKALRSAYEQALAVRHYYTQDDDAPDEPYEEIDDFDSSHHQDELDKISKTKQATNIHLEKTALENDSENAENLKQTINIIHETISHNITGEAQNPQNPKNNLDDNNAPPPLPDINPLTISELSDQWYDCAHHAYQGEGIEMSGKFYEYTDRDRANEKHIDSHLFDVLHTQLKQDFPELPLDEKIEFEEYLIEFFYYSNNIYKLSFALAFEEFHWQNALDSYKAENYPWYQVQEILERYRSTMQTLDNWDEFFAVLSKHYPKVFYYYNPKNYQKNAVVAYVLFTLKSLRPYELPPVNDELQRLHDILLTEQENYPNNGFYNSVLTQSNYVRLHKFIDILGRPFSILITTVAILLLIAFVVVVNTEYSILSAIYCHVVWLFVFFSFWKLRYQLFFHPDKFIWEKPHDIITLSWQRGKIAIFAILFTAIYKDYHLKSILGEIDVAIQSPSYYFAHCFGFMLWLSLLKRLTSASVDFIDEQWVNAFLLVCIAVLMPTISLLTNILEAKDIVHYSPLFWIMLSIPVALQLIINQQQNPWKIITKLQNASLSFNRILQSILIVFVGVYAFLFLVSDQFSLGLLTAISLMLLYYGTKDNG